MNDFTKEELRHLTTLFKLTEVAYPDFPIYDNLWMKIESMIDNYCEHDYRVLSPNVIQCYQCGTGHIINTRGSEK